MSDNAREVMREKQPRLFTDEALASFDSFDAVAALIREQGLATANAADLGNGFSVLANKDKGQLVGVPFMVLDWRFNAGDHGEFVSMMILTKDGRKLIINDGSSGIYQDMRTLTAKMNGGRAVLMCEKGLTRSDYTHTDEKGKETPATTFYISTEKGSL